MNATAGSASDCAVSRIQLRQVRSAQNQHSAKILPLLGLLLLSQSPALARTWTATDGRQIDGDMTAKNADSVEVRRSDSGAVVTIPFSMLSAADIEYVKAANDASLAKLSAGTGDGGAACATLIASFPKLAIQDDNDTQLFKKYAGWVRIMTPANARATVEMMRRRLPDDVKYWTDEAAQPWPDLKERNSEIQQIPMDGTTLHMKQKADMAKKRDADLRAYKAAMKARVTWLTQTLPNWLDQVEKAAP